MSLYEKIISDPIQNWENIPWIAFGYAYAGLFGSIFVLPLLFVGLLLVELFEVVGEPITEKKLQVAIIYTFVFLLLFLVPTILISFASLFFAFNFYIYGSIFIVLAGIWLISYSAVAPAIYYLVGKYNSSGIFKLKRFLTSIGGLQSTQYKQVVKQMIIVNIVFVILTIILFLTIVGIFIIPLLLLWYGYNCGQIYLSLEQNAELSLD